MGIKKYFGEKPQKEPKPFTAQFGIDDDYDVSLIEETKPSYFPSPEKLAEYEELQEGAADRILALVENEQKYRHQWEKEALAKHYITLKTGQFLAFFTSLIIVAAVIYLSIKGYFIPAASLAFAGLLSLALNIKYNIAKQQRFPKRPRKKFKHRNNRSR